MELFLVALAGFTAAMVDGALGMGFGPTSSSILLSTGLSPAAVSTTVNLAKVATGAVAGVAHWRFRNVDRRLVLQLAIPGCLGALIGVTVLNNVDGDQLKPILAVLLILVGLRILFRFSRPLPTATSVPPARRPIDDRAPRFDERGVLDRRRDGRHHQRPGRRVGTGRHAVPPPHGPRAAVRRSDR